MALTFIKYGDRFNYKTIRINTITNENSIQFLNWCRDKELYLYWWGDGYLGVRNIDMVISDISKSRYVIDYITIYYLDDSHPDVVELKLSWL